MTFFKPTKNKIFFFLLINTLLISACEKEQEPIDYQKELNRNSQEINNYIAKENLTGFKRVEKFSSFYYEKKTVVKMDGQVQDAGTTVKLKVKVYDLNGKLLDSTKVNNPIVFTKYNESNQTVQLFTGDLAEGEKATYLMPFTLWSNNGNLEARKVEVEVLSVQTEIETIEEYIQPTPNDYKITEKGIYYKINKTLPEALPFNDKSVIEYTGEFIRITDFYDLNRSYKQKVFDFERQFSASELSKTTIGFQESVNLLKQGEEGKFIIPSYLMYGEKGISISKNYYAIPPFSVLVFRIKIK